MPVMRAENEGYIKHILNTKFMGEDIMYVPFNAFQISTSVYRKIFKKSQYIKLYKVVLKCQWAGKTLKF